MRKEEKFKKSNILNHSLKIERLNQNSIFNQMMLHI
jgi:hypothetical protein